MMKLPRGQRGFTFVEVIIVVVVMAIVLALATPDIMSAIYNVRLRSSANTVARLVQSARMLAVTKNKPYYLHSAVVNGSTLLWASDQPDSTVALDKDPQGVLGGNVQLVMSGYPDGPTLSNTPIRDSLPKFNSHGAPCSIGGGGCTTGTLGYQVYLTDTRSMGANGWVTVIVAPGGRIQVFTYNSGNWGS